MELLSTGVYRGQGIGDGTYCTMWFAVGVRLFFEPAG